METCSWGCFPATSQFGCSLSCRWNRCSASDACASCHLDGNCWNVVCRVCWDITPCYTIYHIYMFYNLSSAGKLNIWPNNPLQLSFFCIIALVHIGDCNFLEDCYLELLFLLYSALSSLKWSPFKIST